MHNTRLASIGTNMLNYVTKCGFLPAEERKKRKTFFSHMAGSMGLSVQGVFRSHGILEFSCFCCLPPLPGLPRPPAHDVFSGL